MTLGDVVTAFVNELKKQNPAPGSVDWNYFVKYISKAFKNGAFVIPKDKQELAKMAHDVITGDYFPSIRDEEGYFFLPPVEDIKAKEIEYSVNYREFYKHIKRGFTPKLVYELTNPKSANVQYIKNHPWVNVNVNVNLRLENMPHIHKINQHFEEMVRGVNNRQISLRTVNVSHWGDTLRKNDVRYLYNQYDLEDLALLEQSVTKLGAKLRFKEVSKSSISWNMNQIKFANDEIRKIAQTIKNNNLSPFEAIIFICTWIQKNIDFNYDDNDYEKNNTIVSAMVNKKCRCVGMTQIVNAVVNCLGPDYLREDYAVMGGETIIISKDDIVESIRDKSISTHSQVKFYMIDPKYNIDGQIIVDPNNFIDSTLVPKYLSNGVVLYSRNPVNNYEGIVKNVSQYNIFDEEGKEYIGFNYEQKTAVSKEVITVNEKPLDSVMQEIKERAIISKVLEQPNITNQMYEQAYNKVLPLVFNDLCAGDIVAPRLYLKDGDLVRDHNIELCRGDKKEYWIEYINSELKKNECKNLKKFKRKQTKSKKFDKSK